MNNKKEHRAVRKQFYRQYGMFMHPLMGYIFDYVEGSRAVKNGRTPFNAEIKVERDIVYKTVGGQQLKMDIYYPSHFISDRVPAVMDIPGGGWMITNRARRDGYARCFAAMGAVVAVIEHRLCPSVFFPDNLADCIDAYNFLAINSHKFHLDPANITVTGDSSGGHMAACLGVAATDNSYCKGLGIPAPAIKPAGMIFVSGAFSFKVMYRIPFTHTLMVRYVSGMRTRKQFKSWHLNRYIEPYNFINADYPPSYNNGGGSDLLCADEAKRMAGVLTSKGVENEFCVGRNIFNSGHCYLLRFPYKSARKDAFKLYEWYRDREKQLGIDLSTGLERLKTFFNDYKKTLKGEITC